MQFATVQLDDALGDGQAQTQMVAVVLHRLRTAIKPVEHMRQIPWFDTVAGVGDGEDGGSVRRSQFQGDDTGGRRVLQGVEDQIVQHSFQQTDVGVHEQRHGRQTHDQADATLAGG